jgi:hypothetical protein
VEVNNTEVPGTVNQVQAPVETVEEVTPAPVVEQPVAPQTVQQQTVAAPVNEEVKKGGSSKIIIIVLVILLLAAIGFVIYKYVLPKDNNAPKDNNPTSNTVDNTDNNTPVEPVDDEMDENETTDTLPESDSCPKIGRYRFERGKLDNDTVYAYLLLRSDGTYTFGNDSHFSGARSVGTYKVEGDKLKLHDTVYYGSDSCYFTEGDSVLDRVLTIDNCTTLSMDKTDPLMVFNYESGVKKKHLKKQDM